MSKETLGALVAELAVQALIQEFAQIIRHFVHMLDAPWLTKDKKEEMAEYVAACLNKVAEEMKFFPPTDFTKREEQNKELVNILLRRCK